MPQNTSQYLRRSISSLFRKPWWSAQSMWNKVVYFIHIKQEYNIIQAVLWCTRWYIVMPRISSIPMQNVTKDELNVLPRCCRNILEEDSERMVKFNMFRQNSCISKCGKRVEQTSLFTPYLVKWHTWTYSPGKTVPCSGHDNFHRTIQIPACAWSASITCDWLKTASPLQPLAVKLPAETGGLLHAHVTEHQLVM